MRDVSLFQKRRNARCGTGPIKPLDGHTGNKSYLVWSLRRPCCLTVFLKEVWMLDYKAVKNRIVAEKQTAYGEKFLAEDIYDHTFIECDLFASEIYKCRINKTLIINSELVALVIQDTKWTASKVIGSALDNADISDTNIENSAFVSSSIDDASFSGGSLVNTSFMKSNSAKASALRASFRNVLLENVIFDGVDLRAATFDDCSFISCSFKNCRMMYSIFQRPSFMNTMFDHCDTRTMVIYEPVSQRAGFRGCSGIKYVETTKEFNMLCDKIRSRIRSIKSDFKTGGSCPVPSNINTIQPSSNSIVSSFAATVFGSEAALESMRNVS